MRLLLAWLVMFGVLAGLSTRALSAVTVLSHSHAHEQGHETEAWHQVDDDHHGHDHDAPEPVDHDSDPESPASPDHHHHHHIDGVTVAIAVLPASEWKIVLTASLLFDGQESKLLVPDGPFPDLDSPPLI